MELEVGSYYAYIGDSFRYFKKGGVYKLIKIEEYSGFIFGRVPVITTEVYKRTKDMDDCCKTNENYIKNNFLRVIKGGKTK